MNFLDNKSTITIIQSYDYDRVIDKILNDIEEKDISLAIDAVTYWTVNHQFVDKPIDGKRIRIQKVIEDILDNKLIIVRGDTIPFTNEQMIAIQQGTDSGRIFFIGDIEVPEMVADIIPVYDMRYAKENLTQFELKNFDVEERKKHKSDGVIVQVTGKEIPLITSNKKKTEIIKKLYEYNTKGVMLVGVPGTGKTMIADVLAKEYPVHKLNIGLIFNKYVGETEKKWHQTRQLIDRMERSIIFIDEFEKVLTTNTESSVDQRFLGNFLQWLEKENKHFIIASANDVTKMPPELLRPGRWSMILGFGVLSVSEAYQLAQTFDVDIEDEILIQENLVPADIANYAQLKKVFGEEAKNFFIKTSDITDKFQEQLQKVKKYVVD